MDEKELHERGLKLRVDMFGREAVEKRMNAFGDFGKPLQHIINAYAYGDVWQRSALPPATKSLAMVAMMAAAGHPNELRVHLKGALKNGCTPEQIQEVLLLLTLYCGIPAANEAHAIATEVCGRAVTVITGLVPVISLREHSARLSGMPATSAGMTLRGCAIHPASCAGLTRASMMSGKVEGPYVPLYLSSSLMDCRVKPGNDGVRGSASLSGMAATSLQPGRPPAGPGCPAMTMRHCLLVTQLTAVVRSASSASRGRACRRRGQSRRPRA